MAPPQPVWENTLPLNDADEELRRLEESRIMEMAKQNPALFAPLYERYFPRVYAYCLRRSNDAQEAEDLCSQVFIRALNGLHMYRGGVVAAWLFQIAHNVVVNHYRARRRVIPLDGLEIADESPGERLEQSEDGRILSELIAALPDDHRDLLSFTIDAGLSSREVGEVVGKSATAVRVQLHRIIKVLRERYLIVTGGR